MQSVRPQLYTICVYFESDLFEYLNTNEIDAMILEKADGESGINMVSVSMMFNIIYMFVLYGHRFHASRFMYTIPGDMILKQ